MFMQQLSSIIIIIIMIRSFPLQGRSTSSALNVLPGNCQKEALWANATVYAWRMLGVLRCGRMVALLHLQGIVFTPLMADNDQGVSRQHVHHVLGRGTM